MTTARGPGSRAGLDRAQVLAAAAEVLAQDGAGALTLRAVARRLGVAPNALYSHVRGTADLVDGVLDDLLSRVPEPTGRVPTRALTALLTSTYEVLVSRPGLVPLYLERQGVRGEQGVRLGAVMDALLERLDVPPSQVGAARNALVVHVMGSAAFAGSAGPEAAMDAVRSRELFDQGLAWLLAGIAATARG